MQLKSIDIFVGMFSLFVMVLANVWGKGFVKMYCLLIGTAGRVDSGADHPA